MATDWSAKLERKGFELLVADLVEKSVERALCDRVEPQLLRIENRLAAMETRLDVADRLAKLEAKVTVLKSNR
jgi:hypothetical protein